MTQRLRVTVESAMDMAIELHKRGELEEAITLYNDVLRAVPEHPDALHYLGVALHQKGESEDALQHIERALELSPDYPDALNNLGNIYRETGRLEDAEKIYKRVLEIAPEHADTLVNMAIALRGLKEPQASMEFLKKALSISPDHPMAYHNLGNIHRDLKQYDQALTAYHRADELEPESEESSKEIAKILYKSGRVDEANDVLQRLIARKPKDAIAKHMLAAFGGADVPARASDVFVRQTFDTYSASFDESLARLEYKGPQLVSNKLIETIGDESRLVDILDIGCGTGLCGPLLRPVAKTLAGVDLSPKMLQKAKRRSVYDDLDEAELTAYMQASERNFDFVICVDTFVYFGDLSEAFVAARDVLLPGGHLVFTVEQHKKDEHGEDFRLQHHGRYSHRKAYLRNALEAAGLVVCSIDDVVPRMEAGEPVSGTLAVAQKI